MRSILRNFVARKYEKKIWNASRFCVSSLRRGHANLLCIVPILLYVPPKWDDEHCQACSYILK